MNQKTLIALGAMVLVAVLAFLTVRAPQKGERVGPRERPLAALKAADAKELEITTNGGKDHVVMKLDGGAWKLTAPAPNPADQAAIKNALDQLEKVSYGDLVTEKKEKLADLELSDEKGAHVIARGDGGKVLFDAVLGKSVSGFTMVRPGGKDQVWQASGLFKYAFAKEAKSWRDHTILAVTREDITRMTVEAGSQKLVLDKVPVEPDKDHPAAPPPDPRWKVVETNIKVDPLDDTVPNSLLSSLASLSAADFDDTGDQAAAGLTTPRHRVTLTAKGTTSTLLVGNAKGDDVWAQVEGKPQIYVLRKYAIERVAVRPVDFRDKTIVNAKEDDLTSIDVSVGADAYTLLHEGSSWKFGKGGAGALDDGKVKSLATAFAEFKGSSFAESTDAATTGLAKPSASLTLHLRDGGTVKVNVGAASKDGSETHVQKVGSPDVLLVKKYQAERITKKASELTKSEAPAK